MGDMAWTGPLLSTAQEPTQSGHGSAFPNGRWPRGNAWLNSVPPLKYNREAMIGVTNRVTVMQPAQGWMGPWRAAPTAEGNQKPGAELRPGCIPEFQFPEWSDLRGSVKPTHFNDVPFLG
jgi:hypothetical protein